LSSAIGEQLEGLKKEPPKQAPLGAVEVSDTQRIFELEIRFDPLRPSPEGVIEIDNAQVPKPGTTIPRLGGYTRYA
jgi:hypothetical protein